MNGAGRSNSSMSLLDILEQFFTKRKGPEDLVEKGILKENPAVPAPGEGTGKYFNRFISAVPQTEGIPTIVTECCLFIENNGMSVPLICFFFCNIDKS